MDDHPRPVAVGAAAALTRPVSLFVYGTLKRGARGRRHPLLRHARLVSPASIAGDLYDLGAYPGVVRGSARRRVLGELYELPGDGAQRALRVLDAYEGRRFVRQRARVTLRDGTRRVAWAYVLRDPPPPSARPIASGRYGRA